MVSGFQSDQSFLCLVRLHTYAFESIVDIKIIFRGLFRLYVRHSASVWVSVVACVPWCAHGHARTAFESVLCSHSVAADCLHSCVYQAGSLWGNSSASALHVTVGVLRWQMDSTTSVCPFMLANFSQQEFTHWAIFLNLNDVFFKVLVNGYSFSFVLM